MSSFRFVHAAHLHLDAPMRGIGAVPASIRSTLRDASLATWERLVRLAIEREAAFLLIAGGLFAEDGPTARAVAALLEGVRELHASGVATFVYLGPEDDAARSCSSALASAASVFDEARASNVPIVRGGVRLATIHAAADVESLVDGSLPLPIGRTGHGVRIAVLPADPERDASTLAEVGVDYWAVGRSHRPEVRSESPWVVAAGTPQGRGPEADEVGPRGAMVVEVEDDRVREVGCVELDCVRFAIVQVDASDLTDPAAAAAGCFLQLDAERVAADDRTVVVDVRLQGETPAGARSDRASFAAAVLAELRHESEGRAESLWWNDVRDLRTPRRPGGREAGRIASVVSERARALAAAPLPRSSFLAQRFDPLRRVWNAEIDLSGATDLVRDAASVALDALESEAFDENSELVD